MEQVSISYAADGCVMAVWKNISIVVWGTQATLPLVDELAKVSDKVLAVHPKVSSIQIIRNTAAIPDSETRAALEKVVEKYYERMHCVALVVEGAGFWASAMRGFETGLLLLQRHRENVSTKTFATSAEVGKWLCPKQQEQGVSIDGEELGRVLAELSVHPALPQPRA